MDAHSGLLMAVKQVELPRGIAKMEARRRDMLSALEREIELLKDLQHDNIVQYLGRQPHFFQLSMLSKAVSDLLLQTLRRMPII